MPTSHAFKKPLGAVTTTFMQNDQGKFRQKCVYVETNELIKKHNFSQKAMFLFKITSSVIFRTPFLT